MKTSQLYIILLIALITLGNSFGFNQYTFTKEIQNIPQEKLYVHLNSTNLFSGERLYFKVYCLNKETNSLSNHSKIAYITLVGDENNILFKQKVKLIKGEGYSDFFIPTFIPSGQYKLVAYTAVTFNQDSNRFFIADLGILNPYLPLNENLTNLVQKDSLQLISPIENIQNNDTFFQIELLKTHYSLREEVTVKLINNNFKWNGSYSISIREIDEITNVKKPDIHKSHSNKIPSNALNNKIKMQPELHGEVLSGKIIANYEGHSLENQGIVLSIPEERVVLKINNTNKEGHFSFNIDDEYISNKVFLQVLGTDRDKFSLQIDEVEEIDFSFLNFEKLNVYQSNEEKIIQKSIKTQIEDSYSSMRLDSQVLINNTTKDIYGTVFTTYTLDDYIRFPTLNETMTEIVTHAWFEKSNSKEREYRLRVRGYVESLQYEAPLVMVDGLFIQDHNVLYDLNAFRIKVIKLFRDKYYYQGHYFQGIIAIETFDKDFYKNIQDSNIFSFNHFRPEYIKEYFKQEYKKGNKKYDRVPDYRSQLLWNPKFKLHTNEKIFNFFTSDNEGLYEIVIEGFSNDGQAVSVKIPFTVKGNIALD